MEVKQLQLPTCAKGKLEQLVNEFDQNAKQSVEWCYDLRDMRVHGQACINLFSRLGIQVDDQSILDIGKAYIVAARKAESTIPAY